VNPQVTLAVATVQYGLSGEAAEQAATQHVWMDLADPKHPDFTTVGALDAGTRSEEQYMGVG
jgi:hypothetical protein